MQKKNLTAFDMFSGCGGFRIGLEKAGIKTIAYCEIDKNAADLYKTYFKAENEVYLKDATKINTGELPDFDILVAGFPCQSFSIAGKRQGFEDTRGTMFFEIARVLRDKRPGYFILENVKGLLNHDNRKTFITIIKTLTDLGYSVEWAVLNCRYFGLPQNRERVFIIGYLGNKSSGKVLPLTMPAGKYNKSGKTILLYWANSKDKWVIAEKDILPALKTQTDICRQTLILQDINITKGAKIGTFRTHIDGKGFRPIKDNICPTIPARAREDGSGQPVIIVPVLTPERKEKRQNGIYTAYDPVYSSETRAVIDFGGRGHSLMLVVRRLTPLECFRLQGQKDDIIKTAYNIGLKDTTLYKIAGNSVPVPVVYEIAKQLLKKVSKNGNIEI